MLKQEGSWSDLRTLAFMPFGCDRAGSVREFPGLISEEFEELVSGADHLVS